MLAGYFEMLKFPLKIVLAVSLRKGNMRLIHYCCLYFQF